MKKIIILLAIFLLTGCYNYHEVNDLGLVSSIAIDYIDNNYKVQIEVINNNKKDIYTTSAKTLGIAFDNLDNIQSNKLVYSHINILLITKNVNISNTLSYFYRNPTSNNNFYIALYNDVNLDNKDNYGLYLSNILSKKYKSNIIKIYNNLTKEIQLPYLENNCFTNNYIYKQNKYILLNDFETKLYNILNSEPGEYLHYEIDNIDYTFFINHAKLIKNNLYLNLTIIDTSNKTKIVEKYNSINSKLCSKLQIDFNKITNKIDAKKINVHTNISKKGLLFE